MFRIAIISILALASTLIASAGQIQVGGVTGLKAVYIASGCSGAGPCVAGSNGGATEQNYDNVLFSGALNGSTAPQPFSTYNQTAGAFGTITDSAANGGAGVTFSMINNGVTAGASNNFWQLPALGNPTMTIPIGVFSVTDVWTMINTELADSGAITRDATVIFNFGTTSNASTVQAVTVKLNNTAPSTPGQDENAVNCGSPSAACGGLANPSSGPLQASGVVNGVTVNAENVYSFGFTSATGSYANAERGNVVLDDQGFIFNNLSLATLGAGLTNLNTYLVSIQIREPAAANSPGGESLALSAITLDTNVPEPSTVLLLMAGLGALGFARFRHSKA